MAQTKNAVMELNSDGTAEVIDTTGCVRIVPDISYEVGQIVYLDVEAIDLAAAAEDEESTKRAMAGDFNAGIISFSGRTKSALARRAFPIAASIALALIFGIGGSVYATGEVAKTVDVDGVSYDLNYFDRVIGVHSEDIADEDIFELKRGMRGKRLDDAVVVYDRIMEEKYPDTEQIKDEQDVKEIENEDDVQDDSGYEPEDDFGYEPDDDTGYEPRDDFGYEPRDDANMNDTRDVDRQPVDGKNNTDKQPPADVSSSAEQEPGQKNEVPGQNNEVPGQGNEVPGQDNKTPGQNKDTQQRQQEPDQKESSGDMQDPPADNGGNMPGGGGQPVGDPPS